MRELEITRGDWRNREEWSGYASAVNEMLITRERPYGVVPTNDKRFARERFARERFARERITEAMNTH